MIFLFLLHYIFRKKKETKLWEKHDHVRDEIINILKHIQAVNFYTPLCCLWKLLELFGNKPLHHLRMVPSFHSDFVVRISFIPFYIILKINNFFKGFRIERPNDMLVSFASNDDKCFWKRLNVLWSIEGKSWGSKPNFG